MADVNGGDVPDGPPENNGVEEKEKYADISDLRAKLRALETERWERSEELGSLKSLIAGFEERQAAAEARLEATRAELERSEEERGALRDAAARAAELEVEVARLRRDLELSTSEAAAAAGELRRLELAAEDLRRRKAVAGLRVEGLEGALARVASEKKSAEAQVAAGRAEIETLKAEIKVLSLKSEQSEAKIDELKKEMEETKIKCSEIQKSKSEDEIRVHELEDSSWIGNAGSARFSRLGSVIAAASSGTIAAALVAYFAYFKK